MRTLENDRSILIHSKKQKGGPSMDKKNNVFYQNRKAIQAICQRDNCDVGVGTSKFIHEAKLSGYQSDLAEWQALCRAYMKDKQRTLADLFQ